MTITKRNGKVESLSKKKISDSISRANDSVKTEDRLTQKQIKRISDSVIEYCENLEEPIDIDILEDVIEQKIMASGGYEVAKQYITYRYEKERIRQNKSLTEKLTASNVQNQNANVDEFSFGGRMGETTSYITRNYALDHLISKKAKHNHNNNEIYIHDLDSYAVGMHNCLSIPFDRLLEEGFKTKQCDIRPAGSVNTAFQLVAVLFQIQSLQQFGGVSATHLDWTMVPYVRLSFYKHYLDGLKYVCKTNLPEGLDKNTIKKTSISDRWYDAKSPAYVYAMDMTKKELYQAVEGMYHNLNTLQSRSAGQLPFDSINYGTCTLPEGQMVIRSLLEVSITGIGKHHLTPIFPCGIFQMMKGVNRKPGDPNYDLFKLALKSTSKRLYPNYANCEWSVDVAAFNQDRDSKQKILDGLSKSDIDKLIERIKENPDIGEHLLVDIVEENGIETIRLNRERRPTEIMSTMGCHGIDTPIKMADGTTKMVQDIVVGDKLMGFGGQTRTVESLIRGTDKLFRISQSAAESYTVNEGHILSLVYSSNDESFGHKFGDVVNMSLFDYMHIIDPARAAFKGYKKDGEKYVISDITVTEIESGDFFGFELDGDKLYLLGDGTVTHNCRTYNGFDLNSIDSYKKNIASVIKDGTLYDNVQSGAAKDGRGNISPNTIILPTLAMQAREKVYPDGVKADDYDENKVIEAFMKLLDRKIVEAKDMLLERFDWQCSQPAKSARFMYENNTMSGYVPEEGIKSALRHGTIVIGQLGLAEALQILVGCDHTTKKGMDLAIRIETLYKEKCAKMKAEYKMGPGVYYTPAESLCYSAMNRFKEKYGEIKNVSDKKFFTNSMHVPVWHKLTPFEKIDIESKLTGFSSGGCITYVEIDSNAQNNIEALEELVNYAMDKDIPYFAINTSSDECLDCGYSGDIGDSCPRCGSKNIQRLRRVTGYLSTSYENFNLGKQSEVEHRTKHNGIEA